VGMRLSRIARLAVAVGAALWIGACATTEQASDVEPSGFLKDYSKLRPGKGNQALLVYIDPDAHFAPYDRVLIDRVTIWHAPGSSIEKVSEEDLQRLAQRLHSALRSQFGHEFEIVEQPGPGTLRIRVAITEAVGSKVALDIATTVLFPIDALTKLATGAHAFVGRAAIEVEVLDAVSNRRLAAAVDERAGGKSFEDSTDTWSDVERAYDFWAERLAVRLATFRAIDAEATE
jgi:hypothetical protein